VPSVEEARSRIVAAMAARPSEHVDLGEAAGRAQRARVGAAPGGRIDKLAIFG